jgi:phosphoglycolate phosphatase
MDEAEVESERTLMVGDSSVDILTAVNSGAKSCGVTYGLRPESLKTHPPDILVDAMPELAAHLGLVIEAA